jgi:aldose 1-epimerase
MASRGLSATSRVFGVLPSGARVDAIRLAAPSGLEATFVT